MTTNDPTAIARRLAAASPVDAAALARLQAAVAARAGADELVDVAVARHDSPLGAILLGATPRGIVRLGLPIEDDDAVLDELASSVSPRVLHAPHAVLDHARRQLDEYFDGRRRRFDVPLDWRLTAGFRRDVLHAAARIPYGKTSSYRAIATAAGSPRAFRATGSALGANPLPILVPCHRVLPSSGGLGGYRGGADAKARLLELERGR